jgi:hypothetical protein
MPFVTTVTVTELVTQLSVRVVGIDVGETVTLGAVVVGFRVERVGLAVGTAVGLDVGCGDGRAVGDVSFIAFK